MSGGSTSLIVPKTSSDIGMANVEMIIDLIANRRFNPAISTSAGLAKTEPAVVVASKIIVTNTGASNRTHTTVIKAGMMNICHDTIVQVNVLIFVRMVAGLSSSVLSEKTTTKNSAIKMNGKHAAARAGNAKPAPIATAIRTEDQTLSFEYARCASNLSHSPYP